MHFVLMTAHSAITYTVLPVCRHPIQVTLSKQDITYHIINCYQHSGPFKHMDCSLDSQLVWTLQRTVSRCKEPKQWLMVIMV